MIRQPVRRFYLQPTPSFPDHPPQRESFDGDEDLARAEAIYEREWRATYHCAGCDDRNCPQCGQLRRGALSSSRKFNK